VVLVPGHHFFTETAVVAAGTPASELAARAALVLEGSAPFSDEQLARGHFAAAGGMVVFAALRRKLAAEQEAWKAAAFVVPDFATWLPAGRAQPGVVVLETAAAVTALDFFNDSVLPHRVVSRPVPVEPGGEEGIAMAREQVLARVVPGGRRVSRYRLGEVACLQERSRYVFDWQPLDGAPAAATALTVAQLWAMDLREPGFLRVKRRDFQWNRIAWNSVLAIGIAAGLLVLGEVALLGGGVLLGQRQAQIDRQAPAARQTELNHGIANRLAAYIDRKPQPLEMLAYLNDLRPRSISYQKVSIENSAQLVIECATATPADVNEYEASLKKAPAIASAEARNIRTRSEGGSTFQLSVAFRPGFSAAKAPAAAAPVSAGPVAPQTVSVQP